MYCHNCGQQLPEDALFCPACGTKVTYGEPASQDAAPVTPIPPGSAAPSSQQFFPENPSSTIPAPAGNPSAGTPKPEPKKKAKRGVLIGGFSAAGVVLVAVVLFVVLNWKSVDYVASVQAFQPFYHSQGLPYTYGEVLDKYVEESKWSVSKGEKNSDLLATVEITGFAKGTDLPISISVDVSKNPDDPDGALYTLQAVSLGGSQFSNTEEAVKFLYHLFIAYYQRLEDLSLVVPNGAVELSQTFTDETSGISFQYPDNWVPIEAEGEFEIASLIDSDNNANSVATITVTQVLSDPFGVFTDEEAAVEQAVNEFHNFFSLENTNLGDVPAVKLVYQTDGLRGTELVTSYWYECGGNSYQFALSCNELTASKYTPIFEAVVESCQIEPAPEPTPAPTPSPTPTPEPTPNFTSMAMDAYRNILSQASSYDFSGGYGDPNPPDATYSYALVPVCPGSDIPGLLLSCTNSTLGMTDIRVFQYDEVSGTVWEPASVLTTGVATAGGYRGSLALMGDGNGLYYYYLYAMTGDSFLERVTIGDGIIHHEEVWSGMVGDGGPTYLQGGEISWYDVYDTAGLQG